MDGLLAYKLHTTAKLKQSQPGSTKVIAKVRFGGKEEWDDGIAIIPCIQASEREDAEGSGMQHNKITQRVVEGARCAVPLSRQSRATHCYPYRWLRLAPPENLRVPSYTRHSRHRLDRLNESQQ